MSGLFDWDKSIIAEGILQTDNLDAMNKYIMEAKIKTKAAEKLRNDWLSWWESLSWYERTIEEDTYDKARNRKHAFDLANAVSNKEKAAVADGIKTGMTTEEMRGQPRRTTVEGNYLEDPAVKEPFVPTRIKVVGAIGLLAVGVVWAAKKVYLDPVLRLRKLGGG